MKLIFVLLSWLGRWQGACHNHSKW